MHICTEEAINTMLPRFADPACRLGARARVPLIAYPMQRVTVSPGFFQSGWVNHTAHTGCHEDQETRGNTSLGDDGVFF